MGWYVDTTDINPEKFEISRIFGAFRVIYDEYDRVLGCILGYSEVEMSHLIYLVYVCV